MFVKYVWTKQDAIVFAHQDFKMVQIKEFNHKEIEKCKISKKSIDTLKDKYSVIIECEGEKIVDVGFYKSEFLNSLIKEKGELIRNEWNEKQKNMVGNILGNIKFPMTDKVIKI